MSVSSKLILIAKIKEHITGDNYKEDLELTPKATLIYMSSRSTKDIKFYSINQKYGLFRRVSHDLDRIIDSILRCLDIKNLWI
jgi:6-phosphogluconolactonase (cycloisomerase 2 family)